MNERPASEELALPSPGDTLSGKYRIERALGRGGMGAVFEASHLITHKRFAIKWLLQGRSGKAVRRFIREAQVAGRIEHPNIVEVYDVCQQGDAFYLVMELLRGESLAERLKKTGRLTPHDACNLLRETMSGVAALHAAGIIHRDLKPDNIFLCTEPGRSSELPKVLDFGISRLAETTPLESITQQPGAVIGSPHYMAPEQVRGAPIDHQVDVYSLGVILYELLTGSCPFSGQSYAELLLKVAEGKHRLVEELVPDLPPGLSSIVERALHPTKSLRLASVLEFIAALEPFATPGENSPQPRVPYRGRLRTSMPGVAAFVLVAGAVLAAYGFLREATPGRTESFPSATIPVPRSVAASTPSHGSPAAAVSVGGGLSASCTEGPTECAEVKTDAGADHAPSPPFARGPAALRPRASKRESGTETLPPRAARAENSSSSVDAGAMSTPAGRAPGGPSYRLDRSGF